MDVRKDRLKRLKEGFITKERFEELDKQARDLKVKKRSKIIKEVNQENEEEIIQKILRRKRQMEIDEENKVTGMRNLTKKVNYSRNNPYRPRRSLWIPKLM